MGRTVAALERHGELEITDEAWAQLLAMPAATIDRLRAAKRRRLRLKGMSHAKPGSLLKSEIPVRTLAEWDQGRPGFLETDLVGHEGGDPRGEFAYSLSAYAESCRFLYDETCRMRAGETTRLIMG